MNVTADMVRQLIADHDNNRPRSRQTAVGPSDLSSPCSRRLVYQILGVPRVVPDTVNLSAWVGTQMHRGMELAAENHPDWQTEVQVGLELSPGLVLSGTLDAYHRPSRTVLDYKSCGPSALQKYRRRMPDNYETQIDVYGLLAVLSGRFTVDNVAIALIPRNGTLNDIHVMTRPWNQDRADAAIKRFEALHTAAAAGPAVLPLTPAAHDCKFCAWWNPGTDDLTTGCPGQPATDSSPQIAAWEPNTRERARA